MYAVTKAVWAVAAGLAATNQLLCETGPTNQRLIAKVLEAVRALKHAVSIAY